MGSRRATATGKAVRMRRRGIEREDDYGYDMTLIMEVVPLPTTWIILATRQTTDALNLRRVREDI